MRIQQAAAICILAHCLCATAFAQPAGSVAIYQMRIRMMSAPTRLEIAGTLRLPSAMPADQDFVLVMTERARGLKLELIDEVGRSSAVSAEKQPTDDPPERRKWLVHWPPAASKSHLLLRFSYALDAGAEPIFYLGAEGAFASGLSTAWYPQLVDADGIRLLATGDLQFEVPLGQIVCAAGRSARPQGSGSARSFHFRLTQPVYIAFASGRYEFRNEGRLSLYLLRERKAARSYLRDVKRVIGALTAEFGPFPYRGFALVEVPAEAGRAAGFDGASLDGMLLAIDTFLDRPFNVAFYGHEIGHQWWGGVIRRKGPSGAYLMDEALAQWGSLRAVEKLAGKKAAEQYRRFGYPGYYFEYSGFHYLRRTQQGFDHSLAGLPISDGTLSRRVADSKGMFVWDMLAATVGRERFRMILREIIRKNWFRRMTWKELWNAIEHGAGQDLKWFYQQWLERTGAPSWRLEWHQDGTRVRGYIEQREPPYQLALKLLIKGEDCRSQMQVLRIDRTRTEFEWSVPFRVASVVADPEYEVLHWTDDYRREAAALEPYTRGDLALLYGKSKEAKDLFRAARPLTPESDPHGLGFLLEFGLGQALLDLGELETARDHLDRSLSSPGRRPEAVPEVFAALADLAVRTGDAAGFQAALRGEQLAEHEVARQLTQANCGTKILKSAGARP